MSRLWIVDDSPFETDVARRALTGDHDISCFPDGNAMLERLSHGAPPDVLILDWHLPGMLGPEICRFLRGAPVTAQLPILMLSGTHSSKQALVEGLQAGANDYLIKPYSAIELVARVGALLRAKKLRERAERAEGALHEVLLHLPDPLLALDPQGRISFANESATQLFAGRPLLGQPLAELVPALRKPDARPSGPTQLPDLVIGERVYSPVLGRLTMSEAGETTTLTFRDVSERVLAVERRDKFLAMLGHELRNPLAPILTATQLIQLAPDDKAAVVRAAGIVHRQTARLGRIVDDLLDASRINRGQIELQLQPVSVAAAVRRALETTQPLLDLRHHRVRVAVDESLVVNADEVRLDQVLTNLLHNAAKYTRPSGEIAVSAEADGGEVVVRVADSGIGIRPEMLRAIFDMFVQVDESLHRPEGGLGIGLALARQLVERHGGSIRAESAGDERGSVFTVRLPASQKSVPVVVRPPRVQATGPLRVLLVDDNEDAVELMAEAIALAGHEVRVVHEGLGAVAVAREFSPEVVLLDIGLPNLDGYEVARRLRGDLGLERTLLVALTGYGQPEDARRAKEAGFDRLLVKPVSIEEIDRVIAHGQLERAARAVGE